ncbi:hypothetical protein Bca4012_058826 [Brassica carinata]|uniref:Homeobox domain-containing protein n=1 Tax=Brassica carinata TaxID=52824 RepID=A0A8X7W3U3_BRACI|nr:hypothetical protein Bca52824_016552 [Brassica carinata]
MQLSIELGLAPRHIKFWFQNQRTPEKTHTRGVTGSSESQHRLVQPKEDLRKANELIVSIEKDKAKALDELKQVRKEEVYMKLVPVFNNLFSWQLERVSSIAAKFMEVVLQWLPRDYCL